MFLAACLVTSSALLRDSDMVLKIQFDTAFCIRWLEKKCSSKVVSLIGM